MTHSRFTSICRPSISFLPVALTASLLGFGCRQAGAATLATSDNGIHIDAGTMGGFTLSYPALQTAGQSTPYKLVSKDSDGHTATLHYDGGATVTVSATAADHVTINFATIPDDIKFFKCHMSIPIAFTQGGQWKIADKSAAFPAEKPDSPKLYQGHATSFLLTSGDGSVLHFAIPQYSYEELQDNREWNDSEFEWMFTSPIDPAARLISLPIGDGPLSTGASASAAPVVAGQPGAAPVAAVVKPQWDEFGQLIAGDWPNKLHSADELKSDIDADTAYYAGLKPPALDEYGGLPGSGAKLGLTTTGFFHTQKADGKWMFVDPDGNAFFQLGVCDLTPTDDATLVNGRQASYSGLPDKHGDTAGAYLSGLYGVISFHLANMLLKYGAPIKADDYMARMVDRVRKWGFNSGGAFSMISPAEAAVHFPYVSSLPLDPWTGKLPELPGIIGTWDPFEPSNATKMDTAFAARLPERANDPNLIGYFLVNEPHYEDIPTVVPTLKGKYACKQKLVQMLQQKYGTIDAFNAAWGTTNVSFDELNDAVLVPKTKAAYGDVHDFTGLFFDTYFKLVTDTFHKYDTHHLLLGNRLQPGTINNEQLCEISGKYMDVISFNYYTDGLDTEFLSRIHGWTGDKPMLFSEFYWASGSDSGLAGGRPVSSQTERGLAYRNYVEQAAKLGYVIGIQWFTLVDEPASGRFFEGYNGERANTGLISVADRPWKPMLDEMMKTNYHIYDVFLGDQKPYVFNNPRFTASGALHNVVTAPRATGPITIDGTTHNWPGIPPERISGERLILGTNADGFDATYRLCWDQEHLYVLANVNDPTPMLNSQSGANLWNGDGLEIFAGSENLDQSGPLIYSDRQILLGAGQGGKYYYNHAPEQYPSQITVIPGVDGHSYTLEAAIPWAALAVTPQPGTVLLFDLAVDDSSGRGRGRQIAWNGTDKDSVDRSHWGQLKLAN